MLMLAKKLLRVPLTLSFILLSITLLAQDRTVTGKITDSKSGSPVEGASVVPKGTNKGTSTNASGDFSISVPGNINTLVVTSIGFGSNNKRINVTRN